MAPAKADWSSKWLTKPKTRAAQSPSRRQLPKQKVVAVVAVAVVAAIVAVVVVMATVVVAMTAAMRKKPVKS